jgi:TrmH family RNA methyltransferase
VGAHHGLVTDPLATATPAISSLTNARVKAAVRLRDRREREATGLTIVDGARELLRALDSGIVVDHAFVTEELVRSGDARLAVDRLRSIGADVLDVTAPVLAKVGFGDRAEGVVAVVRPPSVGLAELALPADALLLVLEGVEKPGNLGAALRSADGAGADAVIAVDARTDVFNPNVVRASLGTVFSVPVASGSSAETRRWLAEQGLRLVAAVVGAPGIYTDADLTGPLAVVLGSEVDGLTEVWRDPAVEAVALPMAGAADSLNVSIAAAVILYEARRQRDSKET